MGSRPESDHARQRAAQALQTRDIAQLGETVVNLHGGQMDEHVRALASSTLAGAAQYTDDELARPRDMVMLVGMFSGCRQSKAVQDCLQQQQ